VAVVLTATVWAWSSLEPSGLPETGAEAEAVPLTTYYAGRETDPSFSPDASHVAFSWDGEQQQNVDVYVQVIGSARPHRLTSDPSPDFGSAWSPDGKWIAFLRGTAPSVELRLISPLGGAELRVAQFSGGTNISWSPDSRWLVVSGRISPREPNAVFVLSPDGADKRRLTTPAGNTAGDFHPAVSPDGRKLAFVRRTHSG
jgi:Tol biopolymer transport system component